MRIISVKNTSALKKVGGGDFYAMEIPYHSPTCNAIFAAFDWYTNGSNVNTVHRTLTADGCFAQREDLDEVEAVNFPWPDPEKYIDPELCKKLVTEFVIPGAKKLIDIAHSYGVKIVFHSCGSIVDAIQPIQAKADVHAAGND